MDFTAAQGSSGHPQGRDSNLRGSFKESISKKFNMPSFKKNNTFETGRLEQQMALPDDVPVI